MIDLQDIVKTYKTQGSSFNALSGISISIVKGEFVAIVGKSGSGKSTLMHIASGLDNPSNGKVIIDENDISSLTSNQLAAFRSSKVGFIFQKFYLESNYTVEQNMMVPFLYGNKPYDKTRIGTLLQMFGLSSKKKNKAKTLSGGEQQRLCIARSLVNDPDYIFADEPCGNLDSENTQIVMDMLSLLNSSGKTIIIVTHDPDEAKCANRIITLKDGILVSDDIAHSEIDLSNDLGVYDEKTLS